MAENGDNEKMAALEAKICHQIEYYFGDFNLPRDKFLKEQIKLDEGWVPLETMIKFNRLNRLTTDFNVIVQALSKSKANLMEVSADKTKIRRSPSRPLPEVTDEYKNDVKNRSVYIKGFPTDATLDDIKEWLDDKGQILNIQMRRTLHKTFKGSIFAVFDSIQSAKKFVDTPGQKYKDTNLLILFKEDYFAKKNEERKQSKVEAKLKAKQEHEGRHKPGSTETRALEGKMGCLLKFSGDLDDQTCREDLHFLFSNHGEIKWIDFVRGAKEGIILFKEKAKDALEKARSANNGNLLLRNKKVTWKVLEGHAEKDAMKKITDDQHAIRGLHYDVQRAVLMKIDAFHYIQMGTVYRGLSVVPDEEVIDMYEGSHVPLEQMSDFYGKSSHGNTMKQFMDIFSLPEMTLLSCVNEHFLKNNIDYEPVHLYKDVKDSIRDVHIKGIMYRAIEADIEKYICYAEQTRAVLAKLAAHGKKMFLITNSPSSFVDKGMRYIVGKDWRDLFDVVIVQAEKPNFFNDKRRPFRKVNEKGVLLWDKIHKLQKGQIYKQGNLYEFLKLTGWRGSKVLYFGDHIYSDLADLTLKHGWRTGAIIPELRSELRIMNTEQYIQTMTWLQTLTGLLEQMQVHRDAQSQLVLQEWKKERKEMREMTKSFFNAQFGSLFRTDQNPTYFLRRLSRFADIYMASLSCLLNYDVNHTFYPRRTPLQHELPAWSDSPSAFKAPLLQEAQAK